MIEYGEVVQKLLIFQQTPMLYWVFNVISFYYSHQQMEIDFFIVNKSTIISIKNVQCFLRVVK